MTLTSGFLPTDHPALQPMNARDAMKFGFYQSLRTLTQGLSPASLTAHEFKVFSQNGEDGVTLEILRRIGVVHEFFVEFGGGPGLENNTRVLTDLLGWRGVLMECDDVTFELLRRSLGGREEQVAVRQERVTPDNVEDLLRRNGVPADLDVLSIDVDGIDYYIWEALEAFTPRLVVIEYNGSLPDTPLVQPSDGPAWQGTSFFGASLEALIQLGRRKGYTLAHTELTGLNAFFVRDDLFERLGPLQVPKRPMNLNLRIGGHPDDLDGRSYLVPD